MQHARPDRRPTRRGSNVRELRPPRPPAAAVLELGRPDPGYLVALVALISVGLIMVYSATAAYHDTADLVKMGVWMMLGIPGLFIASRLPMQFWRKITPVLLVVTFGVLLSLEIPGNPLAVNRNGATRWLGIGSYTVQPSEVAKLGLVLFSARFLERRGQKMKVRDWLTYLLVLGAFAGVIYKEPDLGTAMCLAGSAFCMLIAAGVDWKKLTAGLAIVAALILTLAWNTPHQKKRLDSWLNPWAEQYRQDGGYQVIQSWVAMSRGGLMGVGLGQSIHKLGNRLPESETDFIFAIVAEELGMLRAMGVLLLFGLLAWRGYEIAARAPDRYSSLVASGITSWIAVQACLNIAVVTGTVPNTGVPLPFISSGGSSLVTLMVATGIVIGISRRKRRTA